MTLDNTTPDGTLEQQDKAILRMPNVPTELAELYAGKSDRDLIYILLDNVATLQASHNEILGHVRTISDSVAPVLDKLQDSPILRMLGG